MRRYTRLIIACAILLSGVILSPSFALPSKGFAWQQYALVYGTPVLSISPTSLSYSAYAGDENPAAQSFSISNTGGGTLTWTAAVATTSGGSWLSVSAASGIAPATVNVTANIAGLGAGTYTGKITVTGIGATSSPQEIAVTATVIQPPNLTVTQIEVNQAVQQVSGGADQVYLIAGRPAIVRATIGIADSSSAVSGVTARLSGASSGGSSLPGSPLVPYNVVGGMTVPLSPSRSNLNDTLNFLLPPSWLQPGVSLTVQVNPNQTVVESNYSDNSRTAVPTVQTAPTLQVMLVPIAYQHQGAGQVYTSALQDNVAFLSLLQRTYPIVNGQYTLHPEYRFSGDLTTAAGWRQLLRELELLRLQEHPGAGETDRTPKYYGVVPAAAGIAYTYNGLAYQPGNSGVGLITNQEALPRNLAFNLGLLRVACGDNPANPNSSYPYAGGAIGDSTVMGLDMYVPELKSPTGSYDLMTTCTPAWISYDTSHQVATALDGLSSSSVIAQTDYAGWLISGRINSGGASGSLDYAYPLTATAIVSGAGTGDYQIKILGQSGGEYAYSFDPTPIVAQENPSAQPSDFGFAVPRLITDPERVQLLQGSTILVDLPATITAPTLTTPTFTSAGDTITLSWQTDSDTKVHIFYSRNDGTSWQVIAMNLPGTTTSLVVDKAQLPGSSNGLFKVVAFNNTQATEATLQVGAIANKAPVTGIIPASGTRSLGANHALLLTGVAFDLEDGYLSGSRLQWVKGASTLGSDVHLALPSGLSGGGAHLIKLIATDSGNTTGQSSLLVNVSGYVYLPLILRN
jgi:hypothetical protein